MDELVEQHLEARRIVSEHGRGGLEARHIAVVVGAEDVDGRVEAALELVLHVGDVGREVEERAVGRADQRPVLVVAVRGRARPQRPLRLVGLEPGQ